MTTQIGNTAAVVKQPNTVITGGGPAATGPSREIGTEAKRISDLIAG